MIQKWASWIFGALNVFVAIFLVATVDWSAVASAPAGPFSAVMIGIGVIAAGTGIGWATAGADMAATSAEASEPASGSTAPRPA